MGISTLRLMRRAAPLLLLGLMLFTPPRAQSQPTENADLERVNRRLKSLVGSIDQFRWSNVSVYKLGNEYTARIAKFLSQADEPDKQRLCAIVNSWLAEEQSCAGIYDAISSAALRADPNRNFGRFKTLVAATLQAQEDIEYVEDEELRDAANLALSIRSRIESRPNTFYLITSRDINRPRLIALVGMSGSEAAGNLRIAGDAFTWAGGDLYEQLSLNSNDSGMYEELKMAVRDRNDAVVQNRTFALRNLDSVTFGDRTRVQAIAIDEGQYEWVLTGISEGRPLRGEAKAEDTNAIQGGFGGLLSGFEEESGTGLFANAQVPGTGEYPYEITVGSDILASFRAYDIANKTQPKSRWGLELRNNFDEINYPSIWGGRMTLNAILENIRIGAVLPTFRFGGATIDSSGLGESRQQIIGGFGGAVSGDFAFPILSKSGLFSFYASYTFSEANTEGLRETKFMQATDGQEAIISQGDLGYMVRYAVQAYYSFGFYADIEAKHLFRMKIGGTVYGVDQFVRRTDPMVPPDSSGEVAPALILQKIEGAAESKGGVAAKLEYMRGGAKYPFGASLQYFDQSVLGEVWFQFIINQQWDLKLGGKYFTTILRDPYAWENPNLIVPTLSIRYHFGGSAPVAQP